MADPEALASSLGSHGFRLDALVTVLDAEAAADALEQAVARRQVWAWARLFTV